MKNYTIEELKNQFKKLNYTWFPFHLIGIRSNADIPNVFDDKLYLVEGDTLYEYKITTNSGTYYLKNLLNPNGTFILQPKQFINTWQLGFHKGKEALVQAKEVSGYRDKNLDNKSDAKGIIYTGFFGINIHRASTNVITKTIDNWSAGCQVFEEEKKFIEFLEKCKKSKLSVFTYSVLNEF